MVKKIITALVCFCLPLKLFYWLLNLMGHRIHKGARIGFSLVWIDKQLELMKGAEIGHFNLIRIDNLNIGERAYINKFNNIKGPINIILDTDAAIGNGMKINRARLGITYDVAELRLGILSKLTSNHRLDCTRSIIIGNYTTVAGHDCQLWTHGYYHDKTGPGRFRLDGEIHIGDNVYIGSRTIITAGIKIANAAVVGANSVVSKSLEKSGTYVSQSLRYIEPKENNDIRLKFRKVEGFDICEEVYEK